MDALNTIFERFSIHGHVFNTGPLCRSFNYDKNSGKGYIHILKEGSLRIESQNSPSLEIHAPYLLFYIKPTSHRLIPIDSAAAPVTVCGSLSFDGGAGNPIVQLMPELVPINMCDKQTLRMTIELLFLEAFNQNSGRQTALDRICELLVIQLLRVIVDEQVTSHGLLAGLADPNLAKALDAIHRNPTENWNLEKMAQQAAMSRASFSNKFKEVVGITPGDYLSDWRLGIAKTLLKKGLAISLVSDQVGYSNPTAFTRAFSTKFGKTPSRWLKQLKQESKQTS